MVDKSEQKYELVQQICEMLGLPLFRLSTGSTEPKEMFLAISHEIGLAIPETHHKVEIAREIVEYAGISWSSACESSGGTVTQLGLSKVRDAVVFFTNEDAKKG